MAKLYTQSNVEKKCQLECDIHALKQRNMSIQVFYSTMTDLWDQLALTESIELWAFAPYIASKEEQCLVQLFIALRDILKAFVSQFSIVAHFHQLILLFMSY